MSLDVFDDLHLPPNAPPCPNDSYTEGVHPCGNCLMAGAQGSMQGAQGRRGAVDLGRGREAFGGSQSQSQLGQGRSWEGGSGAGQGREMERFGGSRTNGRNW